RMSSKAQLPLREVRTDGTYAQELILAVVDAVNRQVDVLLSADTLEFGHEQVLELVAFDAEAVGMELLDVLDAVSHDPFAVAPLQVGLAVEQPVDVAAQLDECRIVPLVGVLAFRRIQRQRLDLQMFGPLFKPEAGIIEMTRRPLAHGRIYGISLLLGREGPRSDRRPQAHQRARTVR